VNGEVNVSFLSPKLSEGSLKPQARQSTGKARPRHAPIGSLVTGASSGVSPVPLFFALNLRSLFSPAMKFIIYSCTGRSTRNSRRPRGSLI